MKGRPVPVGVSPPRVPEPDWSLSCAPGPRAAGEPRLAPAQACPVLLLLEGATHRTCGCGEVAELVL